MFSFWTLSSNMTQNNQWNFTLMMIFRRPAAFEDQELAILDITASDMSNAQERKLNSSSQHTGSSNGTESCSTKF